MAYPRLPRIFSNYIDIYVLKYCWFFAKFNNDDSCNFVKKDVNIKRRLGTFFLECLLRSYSNEEFNNNNKNPFIVKINHEFLEN